MEKLFQCHGHDSFFIFTFSPSILTIIEFFNPGICHDIESREKKLIAEAVTFSNPFLGFDFVLIWCLIFNGI